MTNLNSNLVKSIVATAAFLCAIASSVAGQQNRSEPLSTRTIATILPGFSVPFKIDDPKGAYVEVQLYVSKDQGQKWDFHSRQDLTSSEFKFKSDGDGEYWFALKTLDRNRQLIPPGNVIAPELRIIVDTVLPILDFRIESDAAGRVISSWKVTDKNVNVNSVKISHRASGSNDTWIPVEFRPKQLIIRDIYADQIAWWPKTVSHQIDVQFEISDSAGNSVSATRTTTVNKPAIPRRSSSSTTSQLHGNQTKRADCRNGVCAVPPVNPNPQIANSNRLRRQGRAGDLKPRVGSPTELAAPPAPDSRYAADLNRQNQPRRSNPGQDSEPSSIPWASKTNRWTQRDQILNASTLADNQFPIKPPQTAKLQHPYQHVPVVVHPDKAPTTNQVVTEASTKERGDLVISESTTIGRGRPQQAEAPPQHRQQNQLHAQQENNQFALPRSSGSFQSKSIAASRIPAPVNLNRTSDSSAATRLNVNTRRFNLNYDIRAIDPSGVGRVILWGTENGGRSWKSLAVDPDNASPFPVEVQSEGTYGFRVVINSRDGLTGKAPISGDEPDVWVQVDLTRPQVEITSAPYGSGKDAGKLIIQFNAYDQFLTIRPIRLLYSPSPQGPWTTIEEGLRNSGSYAWKVPSQVPEQIYLRIEARDTSKNVGAFQLTSPLDISGLVPRGRIYSVEPIGS